MTFSTKAAYQCDVAGLTPLGKVHIIATGFQHGFTRHLNFEVTDHTGITSTTTATSNAKTNSIIMDYEVAGETTQVVLSGLNSQTTGYITVKKGSSAPQHFALSIPDLIKKKSLVGAVQDGKESNLQELLGSQDPNTAINLYGDLLQHDPDFIEFQNQSEPKEATMPLLAWWCWAIFLTPGTSIVGLAFKTCTGWSHGI